MIKLFTKLGLGVAFLGITFLALSITFKINNTLLEYQTYNGIEILTLNIPQYLRNIETALGSYAKLQLELPEFKFSGNDVIQTIGNSCISIMNGLIVGINIQLYPIRAGGYMIFNILAILGVNVFDPGSSGGIEWLVLFADNVCNGTWSNIPYIPLLS